MVQDVEIVVEKFEGGVTVRWNDVKGMEAPRKLLAPEGTEGIRLGDEVYDDILSIFEGSHGDKVKMTIHYDVL